MGLQKSTSATIDIPSRFREYNFYGYVVDQNAPEAQRGKLALRFIPSGPGPHTIAFEGFLEDVPDNVLTPQQREKLRANLKKCLAYWQGQAGVTGTPDVDDGEPV